MKAMPGPCPRCKGESRFYHIVDDPNVGSVRCSRCSHKQKKTYPRDVAIELWNNPTVKQKKIWDNFIEIGEVRKSDKLKFVIAAATRNGYRYINIREFYYRNRDLQWVPSRDGITIPLTAPLNKGEKFISPYQEMADTLAKAAEVLRDMALLDDTNAVWQEVKETR